MDYRVKPDNDIFFTVLSLPCPDTAILGIKKRTSFWKSL